MGKYHVSGFRIYYATLLTVISEVNPSTYTEQRLWRDNLPCCASSSRVQLLFTRSLDCMERLPCIIELPSMFAQMHLVMFS